MSAPRRRSFAARANRRNTEAARRNQKKLDANPLFAHAGNAVTPPPMERMIAACLDVYGRMGRS